MYKIYCFTFLFTSNNDYHIEDYEMKYNIGGLLVERSLSVIKYVINNISSLYNLWFNKNSV